MKKIQYEEIEKYRAMGFSPFVSQNHLTHFCFEENLLDELKKYKGESIYVKLPTGFYTAFVKEK